MVCHSGALSPHAVAPLLMAAALRLVAVTLSSEEQLKRDMRMKRSIDVYMKFCRRVLMSNKKY